MVHGGSATHCGHRAATHSLCPRGAMAVEGPPPLRLLGLCPCRMAEGGAGLCTHSLTGAGAGGRPGLCLLTSRLFLAFDGKFLRPLPPCCPGAASWDPDVAGPSACWIPEVMGAGRLHPGHPSPPSTPRPSGGGRGLGFTTHNVLCLAQWERALPFRAQASSCPRTQGESQYPH